MKRLIIYAALALLTIGAISCEENFETFDESGIVTSRITSYNVCYTKLLRLVS